jgi:hypothetical protein
MIALIGYTRHGMYYLLLNCYNLWNVRLKNPIKVMPCCTMCSHMKSKESQFKNHLIYKFNVRKFNVNFYDLHVSEWLLFNA